MGEICQSNQILTGGLNVQSSEFRIQDLLLFVAPDNEEFLSTLLVLLFAVQVLKASPFDVFDVLVNRFIYLLVDLIGGFFTEIFFVAVFSQEMVIFVFVRMHPLGC